MFSMARSSYSSIKVSMDLLPFLVYFIILYGDSQIISTPYRIFLSEEKEAEECGVSLCGTESKKDDMSKHVVFFV